MLWFLLVAFAFACIFEYKKVTVLIMCFRVVGVTGFPYGCLSMAPFGVHKCKVHSTRFWGSGVCGLGLLGWRV